MDEVYIDMFPHMMIMTKKYKQTPIKYIPYTYNHSTREAEASESVWVWGQSDLKSKIQNSQGNYTEKPLSQKEKQKIAVVMVSLHNSETLRQLVNYFFKILVVCSQSPSLMCSECLALRCTSCLALLTGSCTQLVPSAWRSFSHWCWSRPKSLGNLGSHSTKLML